MDVYGALWIGALMLASAMIKDPFPPELEEVAVTYFELFPLCLSALHSGLVGDAFCTLGSLAAPWAS